MVIIEETLRKKFAKQNYSKIKHKLLSSSHGDKLFVDDLFPANDNSLFKKTKKMTGVVWKRPHEISDNPKLVQDGINSKDVNQGRLGNCWFVAALSVLASSRIHWEQCVPDFQKQEISEGNYCGIFKFRFWRFGEWIEIVVDDLLPTVNNRLIFTHSSHKNEFWSSLMEKAYAKCYEYLDGGNLSEALQDFSGGICETINIAQEYNDPNKYDHLFEIIKKAYERNSLMACAINIQHESEMEQRLQCGLVKGHAYAITKIESLSLKENRYFGFLRRNSSERLNLIRLRNPWGESEWNGRWSDDSQEWQTVPKNERDKLGLTFENDGEFWMEISDFVIFFNEISICRTINTSMLTLKKTWWESKVFGEWKMPFRAGGCINNRETFCLNPQYMFEISKKDDEILVNLDQFGMRVINTENLTIGFYIMRVEDNRKYRLKIPKQKVCSSVYINSRSVFLRHKLEMGKYIIIPSTFDKNYEGDFLLRIYTDNSNNLKELKRDHPISLFACCGGPFAKYRAYAVTSVTVIQGFDLSNPNGSNTDFDTYVCLTCEGTRVTGNVVRKNLNPNWHTGAVFYRYEINVPVKIEIWIKNTIKDELYGEVVFDGLPDNKTKLLECLIIGTNKFGKRNTGRIEIEVQSMNDTNSI